MKIDQAQLVCSGKFTSGASAAARLRARRGVIALTAIIILSLMIIAALAGAEEMMLEAKAAVNRNDIRQAYLCAHTGIDYCLYLAGQSSTWRSSLGNGQWVKDYAVGGGTVTVTVDDPEDGSVADDPVGIVELTASASKGLARRRVIARAQPPPGEALRYALCALSGKDVKLVKGIHVYGDIRTSGNVVADANVSVVGNIYTLAGKSVDPDLPDADTSVVRTSEAVQAPPVSFNWYNSVSERVAIPLCGAKYRIENVRLAPDSNPYGFTHPDGLYHFDARGKEVVVVNCYVVGTLVITNSPKLKVEGGYYHAPARACYPALLSDGNIEVYLSQPLREADAGTDFNKDEDLEDVFVSQIRGVVYSSARVKGFQEDGSTGPFYLSGAVVANELEIFGNDCHISYDPDLAITPVAGLQGDGLVLIPGSLRQ